MMMICIFYVILISKYEFKLQIYIYEWKYECFLKANVMFEGEQINENVSDVGVIEINTKKKKKKCKFEYK